MISHLVGSLEENNITSVVVDVNGVGYEVWIPMSTADNLPELHQKIKLLTHYHVREDAVMLFGFLTEAERNLFRLLVNYVGGIGPKLALNVLSSMSISSFCNAIRQNDIKLLAKINGVGKKTAERMVVELKDKLDGFGEEAGREIPSGAADVLNRNAQDAISALETLGFKHDAAAKAIRSIVDNEDDGGVTLGAGALIRRALSLLNN